MIKVIGFFYGWHILNNIKNTDSFLKYKEWPNNSVVKKYLQAIFYALPGSIETCSENNYATPY